MKTVDYIGNSKVRKFELQDMAPGEEFFINGDVGIGASIISTHDYADRKTMLESIRDDNRIRFWRFHKSHTQGRAQWYHKSCEVIPVDVAKVIRRCLREKRILAKAV